jgi:hypothetical protein
MWAGFFGGTLLLLTLTFNVGGALTHVLLPWLVVHGASYPALAPLLLPPCTRHILAAGGDLAALPEVATACANRYLGM